MLEEIVDENTEEKIENIWAGRPLEVVVEYDWDIAPSPMLIEWGRDYPEREEEEPEPEPEEEPEPVDNGKTIVQGFDYNPLDLSTTQAFH